MLSERDGVVYYHDLRFGAFGPKEPVFTYDFRKPEKRPFGARGEEMDISRFIGRIKGEKFR